MDSKSLEMLGFGQICEIVAVFTSFSASRELALNLQPLSDYEQIFLLLRQSAEARHLLSLEPAFSIGGAFDIREAVKMATLGKVLEPLSLIEIQQTLAAMCHLRGSLEKMSEEFPLLWNIASGIVELRQLEKDIASCLAPNGEVLDSASPRLAAVRRQRRQVRQQLLDRLKVTMESPRGRTVVQEPIITEREGRYVIPVMIEHRKEIKGIVHDVSNSGATVFIEPWVTVELGNTLRELVVEESHEIERILVSLSSEVGTYEVEISQGVALTAELDLAVAKAKYARKARATEPVLTTFNKDGSTLEGKPAPVLRLVEARHPLLAEKAVPLSVEIGQDFSILVITGPNTGGKTVALKTIGLLSLMAQAGIPIPASAESRIPVFDDVFADIGDEQSIEKTLSTFSWHIGNIVRIINSSTGRSLVLLDELGTSTDPAEGSALARSILLYFFSRGTMAVATTHFSDLKAFAHTTTGLQNASLDFDPVTLAPTYHLTTGIPGGSNAMATAARLGLSPDIVSRAREMLTRGSEEMETLLANLLEEKHGIEALRDELKRKTDEAARRNIELENERRRLTEEERKTIQENRDRVVREAADLIKEIRQAASALRKEQNKQRIEQARQATELAKERLKMEVWQPKTGEIGDETEDEGGITVGDMVRLREANLVATVLSVSEETQQVEVRAGQVKLRLGLNSVEKVKVTPGTETPEFTPVKRPVTSQPVSMELDLRGKRADEVEWALDSYLNAAGLWGLDTQQTHQKLRAKHGKTTQVACIGPAGEKLVRYAVLISDLRCGGRTGVGAVLGAKKLKGFAVNSSGPLSLHDADGFKKLAREIIEGLKTSPGRIRMSDFGTSYLTLGFEKVGIFPVKNFQEGHLEGIEKISEEALAGIKTKNDGCYGCMTKCGQVRQVTGGTYDGAVSEGPDYETIWSLGGNLANTDIGALIAADSLCDRLGLDTVSAGNTIGFAYELYQRGIITKKDTGGLELNWGDHAAMMTLLEKIGNRKGFGKLLGEGTKRAAEQIGKGAQDYAIQVKGLELPAYEPRAVKGYGLILATANIGASHMYGRSRDELSGKKDKLTEVDKGQDAASAEILQATQDAVIQCSFGPVTGFNPQQRSDLLVAATGFKEFADPAYLDRVGERIICLERCFNVREGFDRKDDTLPKRMRTEPLANAGPATGQIYKNLDGLLDEFYDALGYTRQGIPSEKKLKELGLDRVVADIKKYSK